jgi:hypothetical protein
METLDNIAQQAGLSRVDVIKIDAEGREELLSTMRPVVIYERNAEACAHLGLAADGATKLLADLGYRFFVHGRAGNRRSERSSPAYFNIAAIPRTAEARFVPHTECEPLVMSGQEH